MTFEDANFQAALKGLSAGAKFIPTIITIRVGGKIIRRIKYIRKRR